MWSQPQTFNMPFFLHDIILTDGQIHNNTLEMSDGPTGDSPLQLDCASESDDSDECSYEDDCYLVSIS